MEVGDATESGDPALFEKLPIFWHPKERPPLREIYQRLIKLRADYPAFHNDRVIWLRNSDEANRVTIMRLDDKDEFVVVINFSNRPHCRLGRSPARPGIQAGEARRHAGTAGR